jgi:drug/metabolite transporter (DMT)-like permease
MAYLFLILSTLFWSGNFVISRGMHAAIPPLALSFWRWAGALLLFSLFGISHIVRQRRLVRRHARYVFIQGVLGVAGFNTFIYLAMQSTTAINAVLVNSCIPVLIAVSSWVLYREAMTPRQCLGVLLSLCGVVLIILRGDISSLRGVDFNQGDLLVLVAAAVWALYSANLKRYPSDMHPFTYLMGIMIVGVACLVPFYCIEIYSGRGFAVTPATLSTILYVALFASVLAFIFWNRAVRSVGANKAGPFIHLMPLFSTVLAVIFLDEQLKMYHFQGAFLIFCGIMLTTFRVHQRKRFMLNDPDNGTL